MESVTLLGKRNNDGSYSVLVRAGDLVRLSFVDFYEDTTGQGYQRNEATRATRGNAVRDYIKRCVQARLPPQLFEITASFRGSENAWSWDPLGERDEEVRLGFLALRHEAQKRVLSIIDGGTRLLGIQKAMDERVIDPDILFDARVFTGLSLAQEISQFLLINDKQKKVRTDLGLRVVQRLLDEGKLSDDEHHVLSTVVPETDSWKYDASRIISRLNEDEASPWYGLIQMPGDKSTKPVKLQAVLTSLQPILRNDDFRDCIKRMEEKGALKVDANSATPIEFITRVLRNFWKAVAQVNPDAHNEPMTNVLWGSIGASACHIALSPVLQSILTSSHPDVSVSGFTRMVAPTMISSYPEWFSRPGTKKLSEFYPSEKGDATKRTGAANYRALGQELEREWRAALHADDDVVEISA